METMSKTEMEREAPEKATGVGHVETEPTWYWCADCKLASSKPGDCANCGQPYTETPAGGVPATPFQPKVDHGPGRRAVIGSVVGTLAVLGAIGGVVFALASHGQTYKPAANGSDSASSAVTAASFTISPLHGTLHLDGAWSSDQMVASPLVTVANNVAPGAKVKTEVSALKDGLNLGVVSFPDSDPTSVLSKFVSGTAQKVKQGTDELSVSPSRNLSIAGFTAVAQDFEMRNAQGGVVDRGVFYAVNAGDQVVIIRTVEPPTMNQGDLAAIEKALVAIG